MRFYLALLLLAISASNAISKDEPKAGTATVTISEVQAAQLLIANNCLDDAERVLEHFLAKAPDDSQGQFLLATIAVEQKNYDTAISLFRRILVREPNAERVRLELARAFFLKGDYDNADRQFRFARAGDLDNAVKANVDHFLSAINRLREWTVNFSFALAPIPIRTPPPLPARSASSDCVSPSTKAPAGRAASAWPSTLAGMVAAAGRQYKGPYRSRPLSRRI